MALQAADLQAQASDGLAGTCYSVDFNALVNPSFITSGIWTPDGRNLVVAESFRGEVMIFSREATFLNSTKEFPATLSDAKVTLNGLESLKRGPDDRLFVQDESARVIYELNSDFEVMPEERTRTQWTPEDVTEGIRISGIWKWLPMNRGFLAIADLEFMKVKGPERYKSAFIHYDEAGVQQLFGDRVGDDARNYYRRSLIQTLATLDGNVGYILSLEPQPAILKVQLGDETLAVLTELTGQKVPVLERDRRFRAQGFRQATAWYKDIEASEMPIGLYAWKGSLYLLVKKAMDPVQKTTNWSLVRLDPESGEVISRVGLPTTAAHLTLVWGETLALIEKEPVEGIGSLDIPYMKAPSMVLLPSGWVEKPESGPLSMKARVQCSALR